MTRGSKESACGRARGVKAEPRDRDRPVAETLVKRDNSCWSLLLAHRAPAADRFCRGGPAVVSASARG